MRPSAQFTRSVAANVTYWRTKAQLPAEQKVRALDDDRFNLFRAADFGLGLPETWEDATELVLECYELINYRSYCQEWIPVLERVLENCPENRPDIKIRLYHQLGNLYRTERQFDETLALHQIEEKLALSLQDELHLARANSNQSKTYFLLRRHDDAETRALAALAYFRDKENTVESYAAMLNILGLIAQSRGDLEGSEAWFRHSVESFRKTDLSIELTRVLTNLAILLQSAGKPEQALVAYQEAEKLLELTSYEVEKSNVALSMGTLYFHQGDLAKAEANYQQAYTPIMREAGPLYVSAMITNNLGNVHAQGRLSEAELWLRKSITSFRQANAHLMLANSLATLARTLIAQEQADQIRPLYDEAMAMVTKYPDDAFADSIKRELSLVEDYLPD